MTPADFDFRPSSPPPRITNRDELEAYVKENTPEVMVRLRDAAVGAEKLDATGLAAIKAFLDYAWKGGEDVVAQRPAASEDDVRRLTIELAKRYGLRFNDAG